MMEIFGKEILLKSIGCNLVDEPGKPIPPNVNLFVKVTKGCNAHCLFCSNANCPHPSSAFDIDKLVRILTELQSKGIKVNHLNITGGEPSIVSPLVFKIIDRLNCDEFSNIHLHLNTYGILSESQKLMTHPRWDSISMSLHHYDLNKLSQLYGCSIDANAFQFQGVDMQKMNVSCNLIKGYIDNANEAHKMLDFALALGVPRIGFVALMKVNEYCRENFIDLEEIHWEEIPHVYFTKSMNRGQDCKCSNFLYNKDLKILEIYMRNYANPQYCESSLVFDGEYLRQGFHQNNIIY
ncbi:MAG: radical SAM protein [Bacteroides sp.]|jgi:molybdenum cofactor biosynthesis enzyme MoaA|nr:radical SAM protein [Prevotella sp.]MBP8167642.1 radical SAM protein [Bacteroides sp.]MBP8687719.1 radical SAM protein [Prevotella sp.]